MASSALTQDSAKGRLPLEGVRILDPTYVFALPYTGGLLADLGAEVIKIEGPSRIDITRNGVYSGAFADDEPDGDWWNRTAVYNVLNRGKLSIALDMRNPRAREMFKELVKVSDVVMENFTPRVMKGWGLDYEELRKVKPDIIMVSNTAYGHGDGPYSQYPGQATTQEATHGHCHITGYIGGPPSKAGQSFVDFLAAWAALFAIAAALRHRNHTGQGQWIDIGMYQLGVMQVGDYILDYLANGRLGERMGNRHPHRAPQGCYPARGNDQWVVLSVGTEQQWEALCQVMGQPELAHDPRFADGLSRIKNHDALDAVISQWSRSQERYEAFHTLQKAGIPAAPVFNARDTHLDPHLQARGFLEAVEFPPERKLGRRHLIGRPWNLSGTPVAIRGPGPCLGEHNRHLIQELLGMSAAQVEELEGQGVIGEEPMGIKLAHPSLEDLAFARNLVEYDPDYRKKLGYDKAGPSPGG